MAEIIKHINDTNASYRSLTAGDAKNTDLFFDQGHYSFFGGINRTIKVRLHKTNLSQSILFIASILPRKYDLGAKHYRVEYSPKFVEENLSILDSFFTVDGVKTENRIVEWNVRKDIMQKNGKIDDRLYLNGLQFDLPYTFNGVELVNKFSIRNYLAGGYSDVKMVSNDDDIYDLFITNTTEPYIEDDGIIDEKEEYQKSHDEDSFQQIYYGAPGTGKSHIINKTVCGESVIRTTFHPDSDYSTFVGCYKPTMKSGAGEVISITELKKKLFDLKLKGEAYPCQRFGAQYWNSLINLSSKDIKEILVDCGFTENFNVEIAKGVSVGKEMSSNAEDRIVYEFVDQAFLQAYIQAWKFYDAKNEEIKKQYLVIEEINRGNCAQIFGDLFQLLDRNTYGFSDYPIQADNDMRKQLAKAFKDITISEENKSRINACYKGEKDYVSQVLKGEILLLPDNLYIWATMNTSDQSLFPIDSAFKRRWDWQYMPIAKGREEGKELNWIIEADTNEYDWWSFLTKINEQIGSTTNSEDKKLGFFFCKAKNGKISAETFVGKVIFYLWNDVFKDFGFEGTIFNDEDGSTLSFDKFYSTNNEGKVVVNKDKVQRFLDNLEVDAIVDSDEPGDNNAETGFTRRHIKVVWPDGKIMENNNSTTTLIDVINAIGPAKVAELGMKISGYDLLSREKIGHNKGGYGDSQRPINDGYWLVTKFSTDAKLAKLQEMSSKLNLDLKVSVEG